MLVPATPVTLNLGINMNIELDEVVVLDVTDDALELAAGGAQGGNIITQLVTPLCAYEH